MNTYEKIHYEDFRKKYAYQKSIELFKKIDKLIGVCDTWEKAQLLKQAVNITTSISQGIGSILSDSNKDFHYKVAIKDTYKMIESIKGYEIDDKDSKKVINNCEEVIKLLRTYRKNLQIKK